MHKQNGMTLMIGLILLLAFTLLSVAALITARLEFKMNNNNFLYLRLFHSVESILNDAEKSLPDLVNPVCFSDHPLLKASETMPWITHSACNYFIEQLPVITCIAGTHHKNNVAEFYRITAWKNMADEKPMVLQSYYLAVTNKSCAVANKKIKAGRLAWLQLQ